MKSIIFPISLLLLFLLPSCKETIEEPTTDLSKYSNQIVLDWNLASFEAMGGAAAQHPCLSSRVFAMTHLAMHDALNAIVPRFETYAYHGTHKQADPMAALSSAAYTVLAASAPDQKPMLDARLAAWLAQVPEGAAKTEGIELGKKAAAAILADRAGDAGFLEPVGTVPPSTGQPGQYQAVPPLEFLYAPNWTSVKTFALQNAAQFRISPMPELHSEAYAEAFEEVKRIGRKDSGERSAEQTFVARFWYEFSEIGWNRVARVAAADRKLDLASTARLMALVNMALADAYTSGWDSKFHYNFWRPYTAIRGAEHDGNPYTGADAQWEPAETTPPVQDYPSTHSALGQAAATVLTELLGDNVPFTLTSTTSDPADATRTFNSFNLAAAENAESRVLAGIHFRFSCDKGLELGDKVGKWTVEHHLKPAK
jgi:hypothetical protein